MNSPGCNKLINISLLFSTKAIARLSPFKADCAIKRSLAGFHSQEMKFKEPDYRQTRPASGGHHFIQGITKFFPVVLLLIFVFPVQAQEEVGYVLSISGDWYLKGSRQSIKPWQKLPGGDKIVAREPIKKPSHITVALFNGETIRLRCLEGKECDSQVTLPKTRAGSPHKPSSTGSKGKELSLKEQASKAFKSLFEHPADYVRSLARSGEPDFQEAVLMWNSGQVDLSPVFKELHAGSYNLDAGSVASCQQISPSKSSLMVINWNPQQPASATTNRLKPGLYCLIGGSSYQAWILVTAPEQYKNAHDSFQKAVKTTREWGEAVDRETARAFLRAYLESLATAD